MPSFQTKYSNDVAILKDYGGNGCKLTIHKSVRNPGWEDDESNFKGEKGTVNDEKLEQNIIHARAKVFELAYCNPWSYFTTFTIDKNKFGRYDLEKYHKAFSHWLRNYNKKFDLHLKYLTIPEQHKDGAWHEHGFILGLPMDHLRLFDAEKEKLPKYIRQKLLGGSPVYDFPAYRDKFGFCDFEPIRSLEATAKYVTKYICKDFAKSVSEVNAHLFYSSNGLTRATEIKRGTMSKDIVPDFENEYVKVLWHNTSDVVPILASYINDYSK